MTMGPVSRFVRRSLNPLSTGATNRWYGGFDSPRIHESNCPIAQCRCPDSM